MALSFTTLFGSAQLALQDALRRGLDSTGPMPRAPNYIVATLRRASFSAKFGWEPRENLENFRRDLAVAMNEFVEAHRWSIGGSGTIVINILLREIEEECRVEARAAQSFYVLAVTDDHGTRSVPVGSNPAIVGRAHELHPRGFVGVADARKLFSREHVQVRFHDFRLYARRLGRNLTTLNRAEMGPEEIELHAGDVIQCGAVRIAVESIAGE